MHAIILFPDHPEVLVEQVLVANEITLTLRTTSPTASCPRCGTHCTRVQSRYTRRLHDLPSSGHPVSLILHVRRFFCTKSTCAQKIFTERLPELCRPHAQRTIQLQQALCQLGLASGGQAGAAIGSEQGLSGSRDTILRLVRRHQLPDPPKSPIVGIDDWAWKCRQRYGTLICDLESHQPLDLLADRSVETVSAWFQAHPHIKIVSRDGSSEDASAIKKGVPHARQVSDRWQVAEVVGDRVPDRMQRLLYRAPWDAEAARDRLQQFVIERFGDEEGIGVVDETSFLKKGRHSVGVARQSLGAAGKLENGQVATVLSYAAKGAHVFLDRRLYLPEEWAWDQQRRAEARVPEEVRFATKPEQAIAMLIHAWEQGVPMRWVTGDEVYGDSPRLRETIQAHGRFYVLAVSANTRVWTQRPEVQGPVEQTGGRPRRASRLAAGAPKAQMVSEVIASLPSPAWKRLAVMEGEKGPIEYHWVRTRVVESRDQLPGPDVWLLARRSLSDPKQLAYYLAYAPARTSLETLVRVASSRSTVEQCIEEAKGETGLDEYEVRFWHSWYRHITLSMMAHAWLASIRLQEQGKKGPQPMSLPG